ncbi:hypothetical protein Y88_0646 [Novosphingobium nitrogenifigens DSM 19370]|uniref:EF-hand domain-containing protein n=1 Tax=Novosphingobium nitrogenifigens DSM 19370 TaxID=983920 RepID=F1ZA03_9SPHN|nr:hypothetical protein [Novosphingobium nitrogenifigens]EGD58589.1 hypothetical protein Y88_0646 [Novosphingobium nitrogenifigens DSM 19370]
MNKVVIGALGALLLVAAGVFWWQGRAASVNAPPTPRLALPTEGSTGVDDTIPDGDVGDAMGPALPEVPEETKEQKRFDRLDRDRDGKITRAEMLGPRVKEFRKLDVDGNNLLTFDEWSVKTDNKFKGADHNGDGWLSRDEFATTRAKPKKPACKCQK